MCACSPAYNNFFFAIIINIFFFGSCVYLANLRRRDGNFAQIDCPCFSTGWLTSNLTG